MSWIVLGICGLVIALALYFLWRGLRVMARGRCCEGCGDCPVKESCSSLEAVERVDGGPAGKGRAGP